MFHPDHKTIRCYPLHISVYLKFITDIQAGLTIENELYCRRQVEKTFIIPIKC